MLFQTVEVASALAESGSRVGVLVRVIGMGWGVHPVGSRTLLEKSLLSDFISNSSRLDAEHTQ